MKRCPECLGKGEIICYVCHGTGRDPRPTIKTCACCGGIGHVCCNVCGGDGKIENNDDYRK